MTDRPLSPFANSVLDMLKAGCEHRVTVTAEGIFSAMRAASNCRQLSLQYVCWELEALQRRGLCKEVQIRPELWEWQFVKFQDRPRKTTSEQGRVF